MTFSQWLLIGILAFTGMGRGNTVQAAPIVLSDPYGIESDVFGDLAKFDIRSITFTDITPTNVTVEIRHNYNNGDTALSPFTVGGWQLHVGDLLFDVNNTYTYAVPLVSHDGLNAGDLYEIGDVRVSNSYAPAGFTAGVNYRDQAAARVDTTLAFFHLGAGTSSTIGVGGPEVKTTLSFTPSHSFLHDLDTHGLSVHFAIATCGNDVIDGNIRTDVPEPGVLTLLGVALLGLGVRCRKTRRA